jgi:hypothetical protein
MRIKCEVDRLKDKSLWDVFHEAFKKQLTIKMEVGEHKIEFYFEHDFNITYIDKLRGTQQFSLVLKKG